MDKVYPQKACKECGNPFDLWRKDRLFCSFECKKRYGGRLYMQRRRASGTFVEHKHSKEYQRTWMANYRNQNRKLVQQKARENYWKNIDKERKRFREYAAGKRATDLNFRIRDNLRRRINNAIRKGSKSTHTIELLGCSIESFKLYLESRFESGMTWENYGTVWEIDHIMPCSIFDLTKPEHQKRCFHFSNMKPLPVTINRRKHAKVVTNQYGLL